jgi:site-specific DNA-methyltransferase (adenine-specific)
VKIHPTQKPVGLLNKLIRLFTDEGEVVIDPVAGSGTTLVAAIELNRKAYGFEIKKDYFKQATELINDTILKKKELYELGFFKSKIEKSHPTLF